MHKIDLSKFDLRTDLIIEKDILDTNKNEYRYKDVLVNDITLKKNNSFNKKAGKYITISFSDITDNDNFLNVLHVFIKELRKAIKYYDIGNDDKCLIIGLGNSKIISDALGSKCLEDIIVTRHLYLLNDVDKKFRNVSILEPKVMGLTGIDSFEIIKNVVKEIKPDFIIAIDSLCAADIRRINKTIQITSTGITPGSGIGNTKEELSLETLGVKVIAIGVPTVVDSIVIVSDTINYLIKKISYLKYNKNNLDKLKPINKINYLDNEKNLSDQERKELLGNIGLLNNDELKSLIWEVLSPLEANMIVTTKEIDFVIDKLSKLISQGINKTLHNID